MKTKMTPTKTENANILEYNFSGGNYKPHLLRLLFDTLRHIYLYITSILKSTFRIKWLIEEASCRDFAFKMKIYFNKIILLKNADNSGYLFSCIKGCFTFY